MGPTDRGVSGRDPGGRRVVSLPFTQTVLFRSPIRVGPGESGTSGGTGGTTTGVGTSGRQTSQRYVPRGNSTTARGRRKVNGIMGVDGSRGDERTRHPLSEPERW